MAYCSRCGKPLENGATRCSNCGEYVPRSRPGTRYCTKCGKELPDGFDVCPSCGGVVLNNGYIRKNGVWYKRVRWLDAFLLCLFFGWLGAHRFYEGKIVTGVVYLFTRGCFFIGWAIDLIFIICKPKPYYYVRS